MLLHQGRSYLKIWKDLSSLVALSRLSATYWCYSCFLYIHLCYVPRLTHSTSGLTRSVTTRVEKQDVKPQVERLSRYTSTLTFLNYILSICFWAFADKWGGLVFNILKFLYKPNFDFVTDARIPDILPLFQTFTRIHRLDNGCAFVTTVWFLDNDVYFQNLMYFASDFSRMYFGWRRTWLGY